MEPTQRQYVTTILSSGNLLLGIVNDLLLFMQIERGAVTAERRMLDVNVVIDDVVDMVREKGRKGK
jgi:signal transduction histidine kinase